jgi:eukaryotic-like serine/threonine-protein kinase
VDNQGSVGNEADRALVIAIRLPNGQWAYDPESPLGTPGGFGAVFAGVGVDQLPVAVKRLHVGAADAAHRELRIASGLMRTDLLHVMRVLDAGQDSESEAYYLVMPVAEQSLQEFLEGNGPLPEREAAEVLRQIIAGLLELPELVHRDLKPANVLFMDGRWRIADYGIARFVEESTSAQTLRDCLSPQYAAPEQWRFERATAATDIYALGCIAHALVTGNPPFQGTVTDLQDKHLHQSPPDIAGVSPRFQSICTMMLRKEPTGRPLLSRLAMVLEQHVKSPPDSSTAAVSPLDRLAAAAATHEKEVAAADAVQQQERSEHRRREALAAEARETLWAIARQLAKMISDSVPSANVRESKGSLEINVGTASLELEIESVSGSLSPADFPRSNWDVVCGAVIEVRQDRPLHKRGANLWYTRRTSKAAEYRWYEVGYEGNPLTGRGFQFQPAAVTTEFADRAHGAAMDVVQVSYGPYPIDDEDKEAFCKRWTHVLAEACAGVLQNVPRALPKEI